MKVRPERKGGEIGGKGAMIGREWKGEREGLHVIINRNKKVYMYIIIIIKRKITQVSIFMIYLNWWYKKVVACCVGYFHLVIRISVLQFECASLNAITSVNVHGISFSESSIKMSVVCVYLKLLIEYFILITVGQIGYFFVNDVYLIQLLFFIIILFQSLFVIMYVCFEMFR